MRALPPFLLGLPFAVALASYYGCGSSNETIGGAAGGAASGTGHGGAGLVGGNGQAASAASGGLGQGGSGTALSDAGDFDADFTYDAPPFDAGLDDACVDTTASAEPVPLDIYFMFDRSGSMTEPICTNCTQGDCDVTWPAPPAVGSKWCRAINSIAGYIQDTSANGNRAAMEYFYASNCSGYETPAVGLVNLTAQAGQIITSMNAQQPYDGTPTRPALEGLVAFTAANQTPGRIIIGILITDGNPTTCSPYDNATLRSIAQNHYDATGIHTFFVGMTGATYANLEYWANYTGALSHNDANDACGTCDSCTCHHYNVGDGNPAVFIAALQQIQSSVLGCTYLIPPPSQGLLDPDLVSVEYYPGGVPPAQPLPRVTNAAACTGQGWYYDDNSTPTLIYLCPDSCTTVQGDPLAEIKIRIACQGS